MSKDSLERRREQTAASSDAQVEKLVDVISRSQHNYRELIDNLDQAVFTLSLDGEVRVANRCLSEILGTPFPDLVGHHLSEFIESPTLEQARSALPALLEKGSWSGVIPIHLKSATDVTYFHCWLQSVADDAKGASIIGWARDITDRQESELSFAEFFQSLREGIFFTTADGRFLDANPALVRMLGYDSKEDLQSRHVNEIYFNAAQREDLIRETKAKGLVLDKEIEYRRKDGKKIYCLASVFVIPDPSGRTVRFQGRLVDITERRDIERKLRQEQEFTRRLVECFPDLIVVLDREGRFTYVSERIKEMLGVSPEEYISEQVGQRASPESRSKLEKMRQNIVSGREAHGQIEVEAQHMDGSWKTLRIAASPLYDETGTIVGMVSSGQDITESKRLEQQLAQNEKLASMGQMMVGVAHELNNPLTAILGISDLLRERTTDETSRRHAELILKQARRAANIVQNLLAFSRPPTQRRARLQIEEVIQQALQLERASLSQKQIQVKFAAPPDLPAIEGDHKLLTQVFQNMLANAGQSISAARGSGTIEISLTRANENIRVTITDDGGGIPADIIAKIFDPFFTTKRPSGGSGLGLAICLAVIKDHGGRIQVQSTAGAGAAFHILLPAASGESASAAKQVPATKADVPGVESLRGHSVLVVDDEEAIREIVEDGLRAREMRVHSVGSSEEAISHLTANDCDAVVCDFNLPGLNGEGLLEKLRAERGDTAPRFVFMTGEMFNPATFARYRDMGVRVLQKPFHVSALATLLAEILEPQPSRTK
jgi:PAS domain S-box-containing protein